MQRNEGEGRDVQQLRAKRIQVYFILNKAAEARNVFISMSDLSGWWCRPRMWGKLLPRHLCCRHSNRAQQSITRGGAWRPVRLLWFSAPSPLWWKFQKEKRWITHYKWCQVKKDKSEPNFSSFPTLLFSSLSSVLCVFHCIIAAARRWSLSSGQRLKASESPSSTMSSVFQCTRVLQRITGLHILQWRLCRRKSLQVWHNC